MATTQSNTPTLHSNGLYLVPNRGPFRIHCAIKGCTFVACAKREGQAIRGMVAHLLSPAHVPTVEQQGAA